MSYEAFARKIKDEGTITDPWLDGAPRFAEEPIVLGKSDHSALCEAAERIALAYNEACTLVRDDLELLDGFFGLTPLQKAMWASSQPLWHGIARTDLFLTADGIQTAELNCDTPTGEPEAVVLGELAHVAHPDLVDPNASLGDHFCAMVSAFAERELRRSPRTVGLVYPTEFTEDLPLIRLYRRWLEARGMRVVLGSPYNLSRRADGALCLFDAPIDVMVRHYKSDWWGERVSAWKDEPLADTEPLTRPLSAVLECVLDGSVSIVNPFGAVLPQNKRTMAFMWEHIHRFSPECQSIIERYVPITSRFESMHLEQLRAQKDDWVLKSVFGAEGEEVVVGRLTDVARWSASLEQAQGGQWIAQRYFGARVDDANRSTNFGVFLVAGRACGVYARVQAGPTDGRALSVPVLVRA